MQGGNRFIITLMTLQMILCFFCFLYISEYFFLLQNICISYSGKGKICQKGCRITIKVVQTTHELYCISILYSFV